MSVFIFPDSRFLPWRLLAFWKTYQLRSHGITELTFRCYSLNKYYPDLCFEGCAPFAQAPSTSKHFFAKPHGDIKIQRLEKWKQKAAKLCWDKLNKHLSARDMQRAMGHSVSCSPMAPVCSSFCEGPETKPHFLRHQGRHFSAAWKTWTLETAK